MLDFQNKGTFKLKLDESYAEKVDGLLIEGEEVIESYKSLRDGVVFTNYRIIAIDVSGLIDKRVEYSSIPYSKINVYSVRTAGAWERMKLLGADSELELFVAGHGMLRFEFKKNAKIREISQCITRFQMK